MRNQITNESDSFMDYKAAYTEVFNVVKNKIIPNNESSKQYLKSI